MIKRIIKYIFCNSIIRMLIKLLLSLFYEKKYLCGRFFDKSIIGYYWAFKGIFFQKLLRFNGHVPWPMTPFSIVSNPYNIIFDPDDLNNFQSPG